MSDAMLGEIESELMRRFGPGVAIMPLSTPERMGRRVDGVDLSGRLSPAQARLLVTLLDRYQIVCFSGQDRYGFDVDDLERIANHFGAPIPHPKNYANYGSGEALELLPVERRASTLNNAAFPGVIECLPGCAETGAAPKYPPVRAGRHLMDKFRSTQ